MTTRMTTRPMTILVLGGTRSGKSGVAERLTDEAATGGAVTYVATAFVDDADPDHVARIVAHQTRRPAAWHTVECGPSVDLVDALVSIDHTVIVDSLGTWLTQFDDLTPPVDRLVAAVAAREARALATVLVSEEVGLAVHPPSELGRRYVDAMGTLNQRVAAVADRCLLVVAGRTLELS